MVQFSERMDHFSDSIFTRLAEIKREKLKKGERVIDLSIGTPNIPPAAHIMEALSKAALEPENYVYAICDQEELLKAVADWYDRRYGVKLSPEEEICSLLGSQEGFSHLAMSLIDDGDMVLVPDPCYPIFADGPALVGADLFYMPQKKENGYLIQLQDIPDEIAKQAKMMVVSYPNNPTTAMAPDSFYQELIDFAKRYEIIVLHDNAYSELVFDGKTCGSFLQYPGAMEVGVEFNSLSKTYGLAGARIGFCVGNQAVISKLKTLKSNLDYGMFLPVQKAAVAALTGDQTCVASTRQAYEERRNVLCREFQNIGWYIEKPEATMFVWAKIPEHFQSSEDFAMELVEKSGVLVTPGSAFGPSGEGYVRMALVQDEKVLQEAAELIAESGVLKETRSYDEKYKINTGV